MMILLKLSSATLFVFLAALARAGIVTTDFGALSDIGHRAGNLSIVVIPQPVLFFKTPDFMVFTTLAVFRVTGNKLDSAGVVALPTVYRFNDFKPEPLGFRGPFFSGFLILSIFF
jgi:hypothetical protein